MFCISSSATNKKTLRCEWLSSVQLFLMLGFNRKCPTHFSSGTRSPHLILIGRENSETFQLKLENGCIFTKKTINEGKVNI